jgi:hypothetical protein
MAYWGRDDPPMYYPDGRPSNDSARREGPPGWADQDVKEDWEAWEEFKRERRNRVGDWSDRRREKWG